MGNSPQPIGHCYKTLRKNFRDNGKIIIDFVKRNHFSPTNKSNEEDICVFCGTKKDITKEHVLPKWSFENDPERFFETKINESNQTFMKTTIPTCANCNNVTLSKIEKNINTLFKKINLNNDYFEYDDILNIIRWLEIIEYKFHILEFRRTFIRKGSEEFIPFLKDIPM